MSTSIDLLTGPVAHAWIAKLPAVDEDLAGALDVRAWLSGYLEGAARRHAETVVMDLPDGLKAAEASPDLVRFVSARGMAVLQAWVDLTATVGQHHERWAREAADRAIAAYADRIDDLMAISGAGGRA